MAQEHHRQSHEQESTEAKDLGLFDFLGRKKEEGGQEKPPQVREQAIGTGLEKVHVAEPKEEEKKHESLLEKLHRSSSEKKEKKGLKEKIERKGSGGKKDTSVPVEKVPFEEVSTGHVETTTNRPAVESEEEKGFLEKIKGKFPSGKKKVEHEPAAAAPPPAYAAEVREGEAGKEKKGILEKIKKKIPGHQKDEEKKESGETY